MHRAFMRSSTPIALGLVLAILAALATFSLAGAQSAGGRVRVMHASPDTPAVDIFVDGAKAVTALAFPNNTGYVPLPAGAHNVKVFVSPSDGTGTPALEANLTVAAGKDYTVLAVGEVTKSTLAPVVTSVQVTWNPISLLLLDKKAPATVQAGQVVSYRIRYSTSFVEARDLVVWDTLPNTATNTITYPASYGQNDNVTFVSATGGGVYTATALTVKGVSIPANSVYWDLGTKKEGTTDTLTFSVKTRNGTLNGTTVSNQALADAANAAAVTSQVAVTTVTAVPAPLLEKRAGAGIYTVCAIKAGLGQKCMSYDGVWIDPGHKPCCCGNSKTVGGKCWQVEHYREVRKISQSAKADFDFVFGEWLAIKNIGNSETSRAAKGIHKTEREGPVGRTSSSPAGQPSRRN